jgi:hypothetical protein
VNIHDWHRRGLKPAFATVEQWIIDQLGFLNAEDEACFAIELRGDDDPKGLAVRILVASDKGLFDMVWERPEAVAQRRLVSTHYRWADVRGLRLTGETRIDAASLRHGSPRWRLEIDEPQVVIDRPEESAALLELWTECSKELDRVAGH